VTGDATVAVIVARSENQFDERVFLDPNADNNLNTDDNGDPLPRQEGA
jgi:Na+/H+-dicarboxylate symporter